MIISEHIWLTFVASSWSSRVPEPSIMVALKDANKVCENLSDCKLIATLQYRTIWTIWKSFFFFYFHYLEKFN